ncbi:MAG: hypothetical protein RBU37_15345 [Myxococcota bacterium]|jgi:AGZA family xanthine/uracil permease-like MFS transporter|nr:hypothetical protein [Myxococcota bacterium]
MLKPKHYPWFTAGDSNAFFGLMLDNLTVLAMMAGILVGVFGFPAAFVFSHMIPGTALGVLVGDLAYTWMAFKLAARTGRKDITAMPLGLDTPSSIGIAFAVLGPVWLESQDPMVTWQVGMATMVLMGLLKLALAFTGDWVRRVVPQAGLLGSIAGIAIALLGLMPLMTVFSEPLVGLVALGLVLSTMVARIELPWRLPGAAVAVLLGTAIYYVLGHLGLLHGNFKLPELALTLSMPLPSLGFVDGLSRAIDFLPVAIPFGTLTVIGGINVTESARAAGDDYSTRDILLVEALATLVAGVSGGVAQSTPYIGHPAYKAMGARAGYTLATGLFVGLGGALGYVSFIVDAIPEAAVYPILLFVGLEICAQAFAVCPKRHFPAVALAFLPSLADLVLIMSLSLFAAAAGAGLLSPEMKTQQQVLTVLSNGFILTAMLWGGFLAHLIDRRFTRAAIFLAICALFSLFGIIHSVDPSGRLYWPRAIEQRWPWEFALAYGALAIMVLGLGYRKPAEQPDASA